MTGWSATGERQAHRCRCLKDYNLLSNEIYQQKGRTGSSQSKDRDEIIGDIYENIVSAFERVQDASPGSDDYLLNVLYGSRIAHKLFTPLGFAQENKHTFIRKIKEVLGTIQSSMIERVVEDAVTVYRESFADLGMCAALNLSCFGYLKVLSSHEKKFDFTDMTKDRIRYVSCALLASEGDENGGDGWRFDRERQAGVGIRIMELMRALGLWEYEENRDCLAAMKNLKRRLEEAWDEDSGPEEDRLQRRGAWEGKLQSGADILTAGDLDIHDKFSRILMILELGIFVCGMKENDMDRELAFHIIRLYRDHLYNEDTKRCYYENGGKVFARSCKKVGEAYNASVPAGVKAEDYFKDTISFVLYYYYHNLCTVFKQCSELERRSD